MRGSWWRGQMTLIQRVKGLGDLDPIFDIFNLRLTLVALISTVPHYFEGLDCHLGRFLASSNSATEQ